MLGKEIGRGHFSVVREALCVETGELCAVKVLSKQKMTEVELEMKRTEIEVLRISQHPHIIKLLDIFENDEHLFLVLEYMEGGDLFDYFERRKFQISEEHASRLTRQMAEAIQHLHLLGIMHRDLKPENILMSGDGDDATLKISDFGLSKLLAPKETSREYAGTIPYLAPEIALGESYGKEVDLWTLGTITFSLVTGNLPFSAESKEHALEQIKGGLYRDNLLDIREVS